MEKEKSLQKQNLGRGCLTAVNGNEKSLLQTVKSVDDLLAVRNQFITLTSLRLESPQLADNFIISNMFYVCTVIGIELNEAQKNDLLDEIGQVGWLTMADFKLFLDRMKKHKFYRMNYQELLQEFWKYCDERLERAFELETAKVDTVDDSQRSGEIQHIKQLEIFKIKNSGNQ